MFYCELLTGRPVNVNEPKISLLYISIDSKYYPLTIKVIQKKNTKHF